MVRLACISVPALPLQMMLRDQPELREQPSAVAESGRAQALLLWVNTPARRVGVRPGMRHAEALALAGNLSVHAVQPDAVRAVLVELAKRLHRFSPHVEISSQEPGVFWLSSLGMKRLFRTPSAWVQAIHSEMRARRWHAVAVAGEGHFACYAVARAMRGCAVLPAPAKERQTLALVPLVRLDLPHRDLAAMAQLGVRTLGDLLRLPADGLLERFGAALYRLHRLTQGALSEPLQPQAERPPIEDLLLIEPAETDTARVLFILKGRLPFLLADLAARQEALHTLLLDLTLDDRTHQSLSMRLAYPTREEGLILELVRLKLEGLKLPAGIVEIHIKLITRPRTLEQISLLDAPRRDLAVANRALAQLRAEYGEQAVLHAVLRQGHLPEARFAWEPLQQIKMPQPGPAEHPTLVRRFVPKPEFLADWPKEPKRWIHDRAFEAGQVVSLHGPYAISGGWWGREQRRDYYFAETHTGQVWWLYNDWRQGRWFRQGWVE